MIHNALDIILITIFSFVAGAVLGAATMYQDHQNKIELGYFATDEQIKDMQSRKEKWLKEKTSEKPKYGIQD